MCRRKNKQRKIRNCLRTLFLHNPLKNYYIYNASHSFENEIRNRYKAMRIKFSNINKN